MTILALGRVFVLALLIQIPFLTKAVSCADAILSTDFSARAVTKRLNTQSTIADVMAHFDHFARELSSLSDGTLQILLNEKLAEKYKDQGYLPGLGHNFSHIKTFEDLVTLWKSAEPKYFVTVWAHQVNKLLIQGLVRNETFRESGEKFNLFVLYSQNFLLWRELGVRLSENRFEIAIVTDSASHSGIRKISQKLPELSPNEIFAGLGVVVE